MTALAVASDAWATTLSTPQTNNYCSAVSRAFETARTFLTPTEVVPTRRQLTDDIANAFGILKQANQTSALFSDALDILQSHFGIVRADLARFFHAIAEAEAEAESSNDEDMIGEGGAGAGADVRVMAQLLERSLAWQRAWVGPLRAFNDQHVLTAYTTLFQHLLYAAVPERFPEDLRHLLTTSLAGYSDDDAITENSNANTDTNVAGTTRPRLPWASHLHRLTVIPRYSTTLLRVAYEEIERVAREEAEIGWDERRLDAARRRLSETVVPWMSSVFETHDNPQGMLRSMYSRFDYYLCRAFFDIRTDELFNMIVDYPDSLGGLEDLRECLNRVDQRSVLVDKLRAANLKRLLHPGAETKDVITQYISTIRCLRILDPVGVLLHKVAEPIRRHLRDRPDTIRCIVATLVEEDLQDENEAAEPLASTNDPTIERFWDAKWEPEPMDAAPEFRTGKAADIVGTLVSIYETKEVIVKELQSYLALRLLAIDDYDSVKELRTIELLKIRFGEEALHVCDVMLKDMADSKRIDDHVHGDIRSVVHPLIISRMFWPTIPASSFHLTPGLEAAQAKYEAAFHHFKPDKHLRWLQEMGKVRVRLELEDRVVVEDVTPLQAAIVELFEGDGNETWTEAALMEKLGVDELALRGALAVWAAHGVLKDDGVAWRLLEVAEDPADRSLVMEPAAVAAAVSAPALGVDEARAATGVAFLPQIRGLLTNIGAQKTNTIHRALASVRGYDLTVDELGFFLASAVKGGQLLQRSDASWSV